MHDRFKMRYDRYKRMAKLHGLRYVDTAEMPTLEEIANARHTIARGFALDDTWYNAYEANVAMLLSDRYGITDYEHRSAAAEEILHILFDDCYYGDE